MKDTGVVLGKEEGQARAECSRHVVVGTLEALNKAFAPGSGEVMGHLVAALMGLAEMGS